MDFKIETEEESEIGVTIITVKSNSIPKEFNNYRLIQLSDLHYGPCTKKELIKKAINLSNELKPNTVLLTGDLVQYSATGIRHILATKVSPKIFKWTQYRREVRKLCIELSQILSDLKPSDGMISVFGNHDYHEGLGTITRQLPKEIKWLVNSETEIKKNSNKILISGLDDTRCGIIDINKISKESESSDYFLKILLSHNPDCFVDKNAEKLNNFNITLCGHTHGGQICLPNKKPIISRTKQSKFTRGSYKHNKSLIHISRGLGCGGLPLRLFCPPEIVLIQLSSSI